MSPAYLRRTPARMARTRSVSFDIAPDASKSPGARKMINGRVPLLRLSADTVRTARRGIAALRERLAILCIKAESRPGLSFRPTGEISSLKYRSLTLVRDDKSA